MSVPVTSRNGRKYLDNVPKTRMAKYVYTSAAYTDEIAYHIQYQGTSKLHPIKY